MSSTNAAVLMTVAVLAAAASTASGQITAACTSSLISSFTPCMNFITGSSNGGGSPTNGCCDALGSLISSSTDCACLILTGSVPISLPINRTLAIRLPRLCKSKSVPLQCKATAAPLPSPGSAALAPSVAPLPPFSGTGSTGSDSMTPPSLAPSTSDPASPPELSANPTNQGLNQGQRPLLLPNSGAKISVLHSSSGLMLLVIGTILLKCL